MKKIWEKFRQFFKRHNGMKGAVSIFLALVLMPCMTTALVVVESVRYQSAVDMVNEVIDSSGLSTLANFDGFLEDRFGLLAVDQQKDVQDMFNTYYNYNVKSLGRNFTSTSATVSGLMPLSDKEVFHEQIMDYAEVSGVMNACLELADVEGLLGKMKEKLGLDKLDAHKDTVKSIADAANKIGDFVDHCNKYKTDAYDPYVKENAEYSAAASDFQTEIKELIQAVTNEQKAIDAGTSAYTDPYDSPTVQKAAGECEKARTKYHQEALEMKSSVQKLQSSIEGLYDDFKDLAVDIEKAKSSWNKAKGQKDDANSSDASSEDSSALPDKSSSKSGADKADDQTEEYTIEKFDAVAEAMDKYKTNWQSDLEADAASLQSDATSLSLLDCYGKVDPSDPKGTYYVYADNEKNDELKWYTDNLSELPLKTEKDFSENLAATILALNMEEPISGAMRGSIGKFYDAVKALMDVQLFADGSLDAQVSSASFLNNPAAKQTTSDGLMVDAIKNLASAMKDFTEAANPLGGLWNIVKILKALAEFLIGVGEFIAAVTTWAFDLLGAIVDTVANFSQMGEKFVLCAYAAYNLPCRTTYRSGSSLSGYSYNKIFTAMNGVMNNSYTGAIDDFLNIGSGYGSDPGFRGAETEYLMVGDANELRNQCVAFFNVYMLRLLTNIATIFVDPNVETLATAAGPFAWVVYLAYLLIEPFLDTFFLVNNVDVPFIKTRVYLSVANADELGSKLDELIHQKWTDVTSLPQCVKDAHSKELEDEKKAKDEAAKNSSTNASLPADPNHPVTDTTPGTDLFSMGYTEHLLILLFLNEKEDVLTARLQNLVYMEAKQNDTAYTFDMSKTYSYLDIKVEGTLNGLVHVSSFGQGPFAYAKERKVGY